jgi:hypothetical protein
MQVPAQFVKRAVMTTITPQVIRRPTQIWTIPGVTLGLPPALPGISKNQSPITRSGRTSTMASGAFTYTAATAADFKPSNAASM